MNPAATDPSTVDPSTVDPPAALPVGTVAFVTWDGAHQDYLSSLFLPIFGGLVARGWTVWVYQFSDAPEDHLATIRAGARAHGVGYRHFTTHRRVPLLSIPATLAVGAVQVARAALADRVDVLLPRAILPAAIARMARSHLRRMRAPVPRLVFDADGFMADERAEYAGWSTLRAPYRVLREIEAQTLRCADAVLTRTHEAARILDARAGAGFDPGRVRVVPNPKDPRIFRPAPARARRATRAEHGVPESALWLVYAGSVGPQYLPHRLLALARRVRELRPDARLTILTGQGDAIRPLLRAGDDAWIHVDRRSQPDVARILGAADVGLALRAPGWSQRGVCPIKIAEYLLSGLPVVATRGVGDVESYLDGDGLGWLLDADDPSALDACAHALVAALPDARVRRRCRARGLALFSLDDAIQRYDEALRMPARTVGHEAGPATAAP